MLAELSAELPDGTVVTDPDILASYRQDRAADPNAGTPLAVVRPLRTEEVQTVMRWATKHHVAVVPRGAGTGLSGGATALDGGIVLSTERMRDITVDPVTRTAVTQPGLFNADVKKAVAEYGLWYPPDPSSFEICSIGGNVATNAGGLCCVKYGVTTDYVLGLQVVLADGTAVRLGGPRLKDVAGLSLTKLFVGSEGTLGVVTEVTLKLLPAQHRGCTVVASFDSVSAAADAVVTITGKIRPSMLEFMDAVAINAVEDKLKMGLDRNAGAMMVAASDDRGPAGVEDTEYMARVFTEHGATEVFSTDDPEEGEAFVAARRFAIPAVEAKGALLLEDVGVPLPALADLVSGVEKIAERSRPDDLGDRARRRRQHPPAHRVRPRRRGDDTARTDRVRRDHGPGRRPRRHHHRRARRRTAQAALAGRVPGTRGDGTQSPDQAGARPRRHPQSRRRDLATRQRRQPLPEPQAVDIDAYLSYS